MRRSQARGCASNAHGGASPCCSPGGSQRHAPRPWGPCWIVSPPSNRSSPTSRRAWPTLTFRRPGALRRLGAPPQGARRRSSAATRELASRTGDLEPRPADADRGDRRRPGVARAEIDAAEADIDRLDERAASCCCCPRTRTTTATCIVEIRGAEGGEEANLFARDLFEMYRGLRGAAGVEARGARRRRRRRWAATARSSFLLEGDGVWTA